MPAARPRATLDPVPPDFDLNALVEETPNFKYVDRISCDMIDQQGFEAFDKLVLLHVVLAGKPLIIDGYQSRLDPWTFSSKWLQDNIGDKGEPTRDMRKENQYIQMTIGHYLKNLGQLSEQFFESPTNFKQPLRQRLYLKDIDCPDVWHDKLREMLPPNVFYLNESTGEVGGPGSILESVSTGGKRKGRGIAGAGDLMSSLPGPMRAQNMMCYIGHEGTYTPAHKEMCGSIGHNIMVETSDVMGEEGKPERPGSSIWFMTESKDRKTVSEYWLSILGHDIEVEKHFASVNAWKHAPFTTYVVEQKVGDLILIPSLAPHQVWNRGTRTMKAAWNRTTVDSLELAFKEALPNARMVCRDEQYKNKAIAFYTLQKYAGLLAKARDQQQTAPSPQEAAALRTSPRIRQLQKDFKRLFIIYKGIILSEMFSPDHPHEKNVEYTPFDSNVTCAYCRGNIFNRFLTCKTCDDLLGTPEPEPYDVCMDCYAMGRSCGCISKMRWCEQFKWKDMVQRYEYWRRVYIELEGGVQKENSPLPLAEERAKLGIKTLAQVCQEQLKRRPWFDVHKKGPQEDEEVTEEEIEINDDGTVKKSKKRKSEAWLKKHHACHVCKHRHEAWKMAECSCGRKWCYGTLFRGFDAMPLQIMEQQDWRCPHCREQCFAGACLRDPRQKPHEPKGTLLGHDTRKVADIRSVESLVDFSISNLNWIKEASTDAPIDSARLKRRQEEASRDKENDGIGEHYADEFADPGYQEGLAAGIQYSPDPNAVDPDTSMIDPSLQTPDDVNFQRPNASTTANLAALLNGDMQSSHPQQDGYQPAQQDAYVAPSAVMLGTPDAEGDEDDEFTSYPDANGEGGSKSKKRKRASDGDIIRREAVKKRKPEDRESLPTSTKQYRKEQERKALEEARKAGRFIQMHAALKGKSRVIRLNIGRANMARMASQQASREAGMGTDLVKSDLAPIEPVNPGSLANGLNKTSKSVRIRVEPDEGFNPSKRKRDYQYKKPDGTGSKASRPKKKNQHFEEVEVESEFSSEDEDVGGAAKTSESRRDRRTSAWRSRNQDDDDADMPEMLPDNWKDVGRKRTRPPTNRGRMSNGTFGAAGPAELGGSTQPSQAAPVATMQGTDADASGDEEEDSVLGADDHVNASTDHVNTAAAALRQQQEEENRRAKLEALRLSEPDAGGDGEGAEDDGEAEDEYAYVKGVASSLAPAAKPAPRSSILDRAAAQGKRVRIVSSKGKANSAQAKSGAANGGFKAVNGTT